MGLPKAPDSAPPFLPLEMQAGGQVQKRMQTGGHVKRTDSMSSYDDDNVDESPTREEESTSFSCQIPSWTSNLNGKKILLFIFAVFFCAIVWESFFLDPHERLIPPDFSDKFLLWVQSHPGSGLWAISIVIAGGVVTMVPVGTPLTLGCGYIYRGVYGWKLGIFVATVVSMSGSCLGAVICFLIGRYLMRETVQRWVRKYPLFDAIDVAASEQGLKIMAMLYLTPVLPLGLVSYMCGTTSMSIVSFVVAKIASLPLYLTYTFIGASAHSLIKRGGTTGKNTVDAVEDTKQLEENKFLIVSGLVLSLVMMTLITRHIKKELMKILEKQKREKVGRIDNDKESSDHGDNIDESGVEMGLVARRRGQQKIEHNIDK